MATKKAAQVEDSSAEYSITITMVSEREGRSKAYQTTTFQQTFGDHAAQVEAVQKVFPAVAMAIGGEMVQLGDEGIKANFGK